MSDAAMKRARRMKVDFGLTTRPLAIAPDQVRDLGLDRLNIPTRVGSQGVAVVPD